MRVAAAIRRKLTEALTPIRLDIVDESHKHAGHVGARPEGETHFRVVVVSPAFEGRSRLDRQSMVHAVLEAELADDIHALSLKTLAPAEDTAR